MLSASRAQERLKGIDERLARLRAERERLAARANQTERRRETRRKIVLGGTVFAAVDHEGVPAMTSRADLIAWLDGQLNRPQDRLVFGLARRRGD